MDHHEHHPKLGCGCLEAVILLCMLAVYGACTALVKWAVQL